MIRARPLAPLGIVALLVACPPPSPTPQPPPRSTPASRPATRAPRPRSTPARRKARPKARPRRPALPPASRWKAQRDAWARLVKVEAPLARQGAWLPTPKLRKHFRRQGVWHHPSSDPSRLSAGQRLLLSPTGPAARREANGPAGRAVLTTRAGASLCAAAARRCGLTCTVLAPTAKADLRRQVRFVRDQDLALRVVDGCPGGAQVTVPITIEPAVAALRAPLKSLSRRIRRLARSQSWALSPQPWTTAVPTLTVRRCASAPAPRLAQTAEGLCRLANGIPDLVHHLWFGTAAARHARSEWLEKHLDLAFLDKPAQAGRPPLERAYIRKHYRDRVFNLRRRPSDKAYLIQPLIIVVHHTGSTNLQSALYTLRAKRLGRRQGRHLIFGTLGVGVPYVTGRNGWVYRLFADDRRFGRHTIGLNHSAIGIENVADRHHPMTPAQIDVNVRIIEYIALRHPIRWLIGHREVYQMAHTRYYLEAVPGYCSSKSDPTHQALRAIRKRVAFLGLSGPPTTRPVLTGCRAMFRYFKRQRQRHHR